MIGCSSGLLANQGFFDPQGIVIQYMLAGSPGLLANLWDVTDKDIDRFSMELFQKIEKGETIGSAIFKAKNACKLKYLIGAAPIWYGVPIDVVL